MGLSVYSDSLQTCLLSPFSESAHASIIESSEFLVFWMCRSVRDFELPQYYCSSIDLGGSFSIFSSQNFLHLWSRIWFMFTGSCLSFYVHEFYSAMYKF